MILDIRHRTTYSYGSEVFVEPHHLYFYPAHRNYLSVKSFDIKLSPAPSGLAFRVDAENNAFHQCWFNQEINQMSIEVHMQVATEELNPFNFLVETEPKIDHHQALEIFLKGDKLPESIRSWVRNIEQLSGGNPVTFLTFLNKEIQSNWKHDSRYEPTLLDPSACFEAKNGSCRDLSWMLIQMLRNAHVPARFVSGYSYNPELGNGHELHAWVEAWLPGAGWIGLDPSAGILATDHYVPIAVSHLPENTFPVQGSYRGSTSSELEFEVVIQQIS
ncbi:MAG: transglutaminase family protein [Marinoscillum sp.]